jgi:putative membrane protein
MNQSHHSSISFSKTTTRRPTYPLAHAARHKPRRLPLVLRFAKGAIHNIILVPVLLHSLFTVLIVYLDRYVAGNISIPSTIIPSLSIVVGLMLVFRNSTSYDRFWTGRNCLTTIGTSVRNLARQFLVSARGKGGEQLSEAERQDTEKTIRVLVAVLYAIKHNLRAEFNIPPASLMSESETTPLLSPCAQVAGGSRSRSRATSRRASIDESGLSTPKVEYVGLLPDGLMGYEDQGLGLPLQLCVLVESYIRRGVERGWFHAPQASQMTVQVNSLVDAYGRMETIRSTPIPVAHLYVFIPFPFPFPYHSLPLHCSYLIR